MQARMGECMIVKLKLVKKCPNGHKGEFIVLGNNQCEIQIARNRNPSIEEFATTLIHELLHLWVTILQTHGLKEGIRREHRFINDVVPLINSKLTKHYGR